MNMQTLRDTLGWGFVLWLIGYVLGFALFFLVNPAIMGWIIMPIGIVITLWVLIRKMEPRGMGHYLLIAIVWTALAIGLDYLFIVKLLNPPDGYYKLDVYLYYALTFALPLMVGAFRARA